MNRSRAILGWAAIVCAAAVILVYAVGAQGVKAPEEEPAASGADNIVIDLSRFGKPEKPSVVFPHDRHTAALAKQNKDCFSCHLKEKKPQSLLSDPALQGQPAERMSIKFKRLRDTTANEERRIYHDNCIGCHTAMAEEGVNAGPVVCGECHKEGDAGNPAWKPIGFTLSLHYEHSKAAEDKCGLCHHEYDEKDKKLIYEKGKEGTCRYCHKPEKVNDTVSMSEASHLSCVDCHRSGKEKNLKAGPITCSGCHDAREQQKIKKIEPLPRMARNQPDEVFVKTLRPGEKEENPRMNPVPFAHKAHEGYNDTCRVCHHESMAACSACHDVGKPLKEGGNVKLEKAMHQAGSETSCVGCHHLQQQAKECAGCHGFKSVNALDRNQACQKCHMALPDGTKTPPSGKEAEKEMAERLLQARHSVKETLAPEEIPEKVLMKSLADKYEPVEFPHRKVALSLLKKMNGSQKAAKLAATFHEDKTTVCQGCHHNSPPSATPPRCETCHGRPFDQTNPQKPGILGAFHQQCMGCHEAMGMTKPRECLDCHKEKKS